MQDSAVISAPNIDGRKLQCPKCNRRFIRSEHMRRHLHNHDTLKRFTCHVCSKQFTRSDVLSKHESAHDTKSSEALFLPPSNGSLPSKSRACYACAKAREKCSKELPCVRCSRRYLDCVYPRHKPRGKYPLHSVGRSQSAPRPANIDPVLSPGTLQENLEDIGGNDYEMPAFVFDPTPSKSGNLLTTSTRQRNTSTQNPHWAPTTARPTPSHQLTSIFAPDLSGSAEQWLFRNDRTPESVVAASNPPINWLPFDELIHPNLESILDELVPLSDYNDAHWPFVDTSISANTSPQVESWNLGISPLADIDHRKSNYATQTTSKPDFSTPKGTSIRDVQGDLYATSSNGARNACSARAKRYAIFRTNKVHHTDYCSSPSSTMPNDRAGFSDIQKIDLPDHSVYNPTMAISDFTYDTILEHFENSCLRMQSPSPRFATQNFPPLPLLNVFVGLYFKCFDPIPPFIHLPSLDMNKSWVLTIAIAAIGSHYWQSQELTACPSPLHEFCRLLLQQDSEGAGKGITDLPMLQARVLNHIGLCYSESREVDTVVGSIWSFTLSLVNTKSHENLLKFRNYGLLKSHNWHEWVGAESWRRLYFTTRVLHTMMIYHFNLRIDHGGGVAVDFDLPQEKLWEAQTHEDWVQLYLKTDRNPSLGEATSELFRAKSVLPDLGEFSHCIILHELYNEIANVTTYHNRRLASWTPASEATSIFPASSSELSGSKGRKLTILGHSVEYSNATSDWRNAALDCIDVLHWAANAKIASLAGAEHPMVLHLHYSRIILLVPRVALMTIAESALPVSGVEETSVRQSHTQKAVEAAEHHIREWAQRDSSKARLAVIHSGCVFWHIRRYSRATFYDPISAFYATLALWAYGFYTAKNKNPAPYTSTRFSGRSNCYQEDTGMMEGDLDCNTPELNVELPLKQCVHQHDRIPTFIHLDRPNDDEMVQSFVSSRETSRMSAIVSGAGDICAPEGPALVLKEGRTVLSATSRAWARGSNYIDMLLALETATKSRSFRK